MPEVKLDSFEVDESNRFAVALCKAVVNLEKGYSPLLIHGEPGSGKTHLLSALNAEIGALHPQVSRLYLSDQFPPEKMLAGQRSTDPDGSSEEFIYKAYSQKDILIVDDIERYSRSGKISERFSTLLGAFVDSGKQVVLSSSVPIEKLNGFDDRTLSRLRGGIDVSISAVQPETRLKILKRECEQLGLTLSVDVLQLLMAEAGKDMDYLKKLSAHLRTFSTLTRQKLTRERAEEFISVMRAEMGEDKRTATAEQAYGVWVQSQARKREDDYAGRIGQLEEELSRERERVQALEKRLLAAGPHKQESEAEVAELRARIETLEKELKEKTKALASQERLVASEIAALTKRLQQQEKLAEDLKAGHEKAISEKESRILELEQMLSRVSANLSAATDQEKRAAIAIESLRDELERVKKASKDEVLGLRIQLEKRQEDLKVLGQERELSLEQYEKSKAEMEQRLAETHSEMLLQEKKIESQNNRIAELQKDLETKGREAVEAEKRLRAEAEKREQLEGELKSAIQSLNELKDANTSARSDLEARVESAQAELERAGSEAAQLKKQLKSVSAECEALKQEISRLKDRESGLSETVKERDGLLDGRDKEIKRLNAKITELSKTLEKRERLLATKEKDEAEQIRRLGSEIKERDGRIRELETELADQATRFSTLQDSHEELKAKLEELSSECAKLNEAKQGIEQELSSAHAQANARVEEATARANELQGALEAAQARSSELESDLEQLRKASAEQVEELERSRTEAARLASEQHAALEARLEEALREREGLEAAVSELHGRIEGQTRLIEEKEREHAESVSKLEEQIAARDSCIEELTRQLADSKGELESKTGAIAELNEKARALEAGMEALVSEKQALEARLASVTEESESKLKQSESRLLQAQATFERAREEIATLESKLEAERASSAELVESLRAEAGRREKEFQHAKELLDQKLRSSSDQIQELKAMVESAEQRLEKQRLLIVEEGHENSRLTKLLEEKDRRIGELQKTMESMQEDFLSQGHQDSEIRDKFSSLQAELSAKTELLGAARSECCELQASLEKLKLEADHARKQVERLEAEKSRIQEKEKAHEETLDQLKARATDLQNERHQSEQALLARIQELERALTERDRQMASLQTRLSQSVDAATASRDDEIADLKSRYENEIALLKEELSRWREETEGLKLELARAQREEETPFAEEAEVVAAPITHDAAESVADALPEQGDAETGAEAPAERPVYRARSQVEWKYTFEDFNASDQNVFSLEMAEKIARNLAELYNPLCVYGAEGSGKTHILHAIGDLATACDPSVTTEYFSLEDLFKLITEEPRVLAEWEGNLKLLFIDEFDMSGMPPNDQRKLHHFLKTLAQKKTQIAIASRQPPIKMGYLQEFMLRFLESGLLIRLEVDPEIQEERRQAVEAVVVAARAFGKSDDEEKAPGQPHAEDMSAAEPEAPEVKRDFLDEFLSPDPALTPALFKNHRVFDELEEAFKNPNRKWRNKFPLLLFEDDSKVRHRFFHALGNRLTDAIAERVSLLSIQKLTEMLALTPSFDWNGLLNKLARSRVVLVVDCDNIEKLPASASSYLRAIVEELSSRDVLLMIGMSKRYKKEPIFGSVYKKASRKKL
ncbi:MAG: hypothetical protein Kow0099_03960 [Candidatus Abyssubacteria bacterium]